MPPSQIPKTCPGCGRPSTEQGQPSRRWVYACGSYIYEGESELAKQTDLCIESNAVDTASILIRDLLDALEKFGDGQSMTHPRITMAKLAAKKFLTENP